MDTLFPTDEQTTQSPIDAARASRHAELVRRAHEGHRFTKGEVAELQELEAFIAGDVRPGHCPTQRLYADIWTAQIEKRDERTIRQWVASWRAHCRKNDIDWESDHGLPWISFTIFVAETIQQKRFHTKAPEKEELELEKLKAEMEIKQADAGERNGRLMERDAVDRLNGARILAMRSPLLRLDTNATTWAGMEEFELRQALHQWSANVFRQVIDDDHANQAYEHMRRLESLAEAARALIDSRHDQGEITQDAWDGLEEAVAEVGPNSNWDT